jgi:hypothetical protein
MTLAYELYCDASSLSDLEIDSSSKILLPAPAAPTKSILFSVA